MTIRAEAQAEAERRYPIPAIEDGLELTVLWKGLCSGFVAGVDWRDARAEALRLAAERYFAAYHELVKHPADTDEVHAAWEELRELVEAGRTLQDEGEGNG